MRSLVLIGMAASALAIKVDLLPSQANAPTEPVQPVVEVVPIPIEEAISSGIPIPENAQPVPESQVVSADAAQPVAPIVEPQVVQDVPVLDPVPSPVSEPVAGVDPVVEADTVFDIAAPANSEVAGDDTSATFPVLDPWSDSTGPVYGNPKDGETYGRQPPVDGKDPQCGPECSGEAPYGETPQGSNPDYSYPQGSDPKYPYPHQEGTHPSGSYSPHPTASSSKCSYPVATVTVTSKTTIWAPSSSAQPTSSYTTPAGQSKYAQPAPVSPSSTYTAPYQPSQVPSGSVVGHDTPVATPSTTCGGAKSYPTGSSAVPHQSSECDEFACTVWTTTCPGNSATGSPSDTTIVGPPYPVGNDTHPYPTASASGAHKYWDGRYPALEPDRHQHLEALSQKSQEDDVESE